MLVKGRVARSEDRLSLHAQRWWCRTCRSRPTRDRCRSASPHPAAPRRWSTGCGTCCRRIPAPPPCTSSCSTRGRATTLKLDDGLRVTPTSALMGDLKALLGADCLALMRPASSGAACSPCWRSSGGACRGWSGRSSRPACPTRCSPTAGSAPLPTTSTYHFVDVAIFALSGMVIGDPAGGRCLAAARRPGLADAAGAGRRLAAGRAASPGRWVRGSRPGSTRRRSAPPLRIRSSSPRRPPAPSWSCSPSRRWPPRSTRSWSPGTAGPGPRPAGDGCGRQSGGGRNAANGSVTRSSCKVNRYIAAGRPPLGPEAAVVPVGSSMPRRVRMRCRLVGSTSWASAVA